ACNVNKFERIVSDISVKIQSLRVNKPTFLYQNWVGGDEAGEGVGVHSCLGIIQTAFIVAFVAGELLADGVVAVVQARSTAADAVDLFAKREIIVPRD